MILVPLNLGVDTSSSFKDEDDEYLIAAFNRIPDKNVTAENIPNRKYRCFLIQCVEDLNSNRVRTYDMLDVLIRLQQLRKQGRLGNFTFNKTPNKENNETSND